MKYFIPAFLLIFFYFEYVYADCEEAVNKQIVQAQRLIFLVL